MRNILCLKPFGEPDPVTGRRRCFFAFTDDATEEEMRDFMIRTNRWLRERDAEEGKVPSQGDIACPQILAAENEGMP